MASDRDMLVATQIAYYDFDPDILMANNYDATVRELLEQDPSIYNKLNARLNDDNLSTEERYRYESAIELYHEIVSGESEYGDWKIKAVKDDNSSSGFYGCLIETGSEEAIIGFRGSESNNYNQVYKDWVVADFGLLNNDETRQQQVAEEFMEEINERFDYSSYYITGHSLGGNLSFHAAITAPEDMKEKIVQSYNMDGPGFSQRYLDEHREEIEDCDGMLTHYQWSIVGGLLNQPSNAVDRVVKVKDVDGSGAISTQRHDTSFVEFDENGNVMDGDKDALNQIMDPISKFIDSRVYGFENYVLPILLSPYQALVDIVDWVKDNTSIDEFFMSLFGIEKEANEIQTGSSDFHSNGFHMNFSEMNSFLGVLRECVRTLSQFEDDIDRVRSGLYGISMWNVKRNLRDMRQKVHNLASNMKEYQDAGYEIAGLYQAAEKRIVSAGR